PAIKIFAINIFLPLYKYKHRASSLRIHLDAQKSQINSYIIDIKDIVLSKICTRIAINKPAYELRNIEEVHHTISIQIGRMNTSQGSKPQTGSAVVGGD